MDPPYPFSGVQRHYSDAISENNLTVLCLSAIACQSAFYVGKRSAEGRGKGAIMTTWSESKNFEGAYQEGGRSSSV